METSHSIGHTGTVYTIYTNDTVLVFTALVLKTISFSCLSSVSHLNSGKQFYIFSFPLHCPGYHYCFGQYFIDFNTSHPICLTTASRHNPGPGPPSINKQLEQLAVLNHGLPAFSWIQQNNLNCFPNNGSLRMSEFVYQSVLFL